MKAYGVKAPYDQRFFDVGDCLEFRAPSRLHKMSSKVRRSSRRHWAKKARRAATAEILAELA